MSHWLLASEGSGVSRKERLLGKTKHFQGAAVVVLTLCSLLGQRSLWGLTRHGVILESEVILGFRTHWGRDHSGIWDILGQEVTAIWEMLGGKSV